MLLPCRACTQVHIQFIFQNSKQASSFYIIFARFLIFNSSFHPPFSPFAKNHSPKKTFHLLPKNRLPSQLQDPLEAFGQLPLRHLENRCFWRGVETGVFPPRVFFGKFPNNRGFKAAKTAWLPILFWGLMPGMRIFFLYHFLGAPQRWWAPTPQRWWSAYSRDSLELYRGLGGRN